MRRRGAAEIFKLYRDLEGARRLRHRDAHNLNPIQAPLGLRLVGAHGRRQGSLRLENCGKRPEDDSELASEARGFIMPVIRDWQFFQVHLLLTSYSVLGLDAAWRRPRAGRQPHWQTRSPGPDRCDWGPPVTVTFQVTVIVTPPEPGPGRAGPP